jgi:capsular exopolysaccharide synthesis family protein
MDISPKPAAAAAAGGNQSDSKLHFLDYWRIIRIRKTIILAVFFLVVLTTIAVTFYLPVSYASTVRIKVEKDTPDISPLGSLGLGQQSFDPYYLLTEFEVIQSKKILYQVIAELGLTKYYAKRFKSEIELTEQEAYEQLTREIDVKQFRNTSIIEIRAHSPTNQMAADIANEIAEQYILSRNKGRKERWERGAETLTNQLAEVEKAIVDARQRVDDLREKYNISDIASDSSISVTLDTEKMRHLEMVRADASTRLTMNREFLNQMKNKGPSELRTFLASAAPTAELTKLLGELNMAEQQFASQSLDLGKGSKEIERTTKIIALLNEQIDQQARGIVAAREALVRADSETVKQIAQELETVVSNDARKTRESRPYSQAKRDLEDQMRLKSILMSKNFAEKIDNAIGKSSSVEVIQPAEPAKKPVKPNKLFNIAVGIAVGLMVGVGLAFFIEYLDTSVKTIDDVEQALGSPVLGVIPQNVGALIHEGADSPHAEAYRVLRTNVLFSRKDPNLRTMTVVSGGAGEGKSTTIFNLATIFAQQGSRVLVVDSDLRRPSLHKLLNVSNAIGLTNYLLGQQKLEEVIQTTAVPTLDFLPSGKLPSSSMGILNSVKMKEFIEEAKRRYDFVFFDSPPIMGVSDASILASEVDMAILVIQYRKYPQQMTLRAKQMVEKVGGRMLGVVLNNINISQDSYYYYYSGYYYDYYSKSEDSKPGSEKGDKSGGGKGGSGDKQVLDLKQKY